MQKFKDALIYYDEDIVIASNPFSISRGEIIILPANHYTIIEQVPLPVIEKMGLFAKYISILLFQKLECQGTNIIAENGTAAGQLVPHFGISVVPRFESDSVDLSWNPAQASPSELSSVANSISSSVSQLISVEQSPKKNGDLGKAANESKSSKEFDNVQPSYENASDDEKAAQDSEKDSDAEYYREKFFRLP